MTAALIGLLGAVLGVLLGGGVQVGVGWIERRAAARRAARLLFGDHLLALVAVRSMAALGVWWSDESAPPLDEWRRYREALAASIYGPDFQTVDGAFHRAADLERWRQAGLEAADCVDAAREAARQFVDVGGILLTKGFGGREYAAMERELSEAQVNPWDDDTEAESDGQP